MSKCQSIKPVKEHKWCFLCSLRITMSFLSCGKELTHFINPPTAGVALLIFFTESSRLEETFKIHPVWPCTTTDSPKPHLQVPLVSLQCQCWWGVLWKCRICSWYKLYLTLFLPLFTQHVWYASMIHIIIISYGSISGPLYSHRLGNKTFKSLSPLLFQKCF